MQKLSDEDLIKSLSLNVFYPRELPAFGPADADALGISAFYGAVFSPAAGAANECFYSRELDELGYMRRYSAKRLFLRCKNLTRRDVLEASIYGCDGLLFERADADALGILQGTGLHAAIIAPRRATQIAAVAKKIRIICCANALPAGFCAGFVRE